MEQKIDKIECCLESVTPVKAKEYLDTSAWSRRLSEAVIRTYAEDMKNGRWETNGEAIVFDEIGRLVNGHHRLNAVIRSGQPQNLYVIRGVSEHGIYDRGKTRSYKDTCTTSGTYEKWASSNKAAAMTRLRYMVSGMNYKPSDFEIMEFIKDNASEMKFVYSNIGRVTRKPSVMLAVFYALKCGEDRRKIARFLSKLNSGVVNGKGEEYIVALREYLTTEKFRNFEQREVLLRRTEGSLKKYLSGKTGKHVCMNTKPIFQEKAEKVMKEEGERRAGIEALADKIFDAE